MARVDKYHIGAIGHLFKHYERAKDENGNYIKFHNQNIDLKKTSGNYNLAESQPLPQLIFIRKRLGEVKVLKRSDVKVMCDWVVTLPKGMEREEKTFFRETFKFLSERYGAKNVISAYVHRDETQPHMHFAFVPVVFDQKKQIEKVSAKEVLTRKELQQFHGELDRHMTKVFGKNIGVLNDATKEGNQSIEELKRKTATEAVKRLQEEMKRLQVEIIRLATKDRIKPIKEKKDVVQIHKEDLEAANLALTKMSLLERRADEADHRAYIADRERNLAYNRDYEKELFNSRMQLSRQQSENYRTQKDNKNLQENVERMSEVLIRYPELLREYRQLERKQNQMER